jgi:hypothetical protein
MARPFIPIVWPPEVDELLGTLSDRELARHLGLDPHTVQRRRQQLGIPPWRQQRRVLAIVCVICGKETPVVGKRASRLRLTCPPRRPGGVSAHHRELIRRNLLKTQARYSPKSLRAMLKKVPGMGMIDPLDA